MSKTGEVQNTAEGSLKEPKSKVLKAVQTPLGFFTLAVLVIEAILGVLTGLSTGSDRTYIIVGMLAAFLLLIVAVTVITAWRPETLYGLPARDREHTMTTPVMADLLDDQENLLSSAEELKSLLKRLFPQLPQGIEPEEWHIVMGLLRDHIRDSGELVDKIKKIHESVTQSKDALVPSKAKDNS